MKIASFNPREIDISSERLNLFLFRRGLLNVIESS